MLISPSSENWRFGQAAGRLQASLLSRALRWSLREAAAHQAASRGRAGWQIGWQSSTRRAGGWHRQRAVPVGLAEAGVHRAGLQSVQRWCVWRNRWRAVLLAVAVIRLDPSASGNRDALNAVRDDRLLGRRWRRQRRELIAVHLGTGRGRRRRQRAEILLRQKHFLGTFRLVNAGSESHGTRRSRCRHLRHLNLATQQRADVVLNLSQRRCPVSIAVLFVLFDWRRQLTARCRSRFSCVGGRERNH